MYREEHDILQPEEIKEIREHYNLEQEDFSLLLGFAPKMIAHYERGSLPSKEHSNGIREAQIHAVMATLLERNGDKVSAAVREILSAKLETSATTDEFAEIEHTSYVEINEATQMIMVHTSHQEIVKLLAEIDFQLIHKSDLTWCFELPLEQLRKKAEAMRKKQQRENRSVSRSQSVKESLNMLVQPAFA